MPSMVVNATTVEERIASMERATEKLTKTVKEKTFRSLISLNENIPDSQKPTSFPGFVQLPTVKNKEKVIETEQTSQ
ncbi:hypothetical protein O6P43_001121 [Quillaja saponaria]|uniref:Uncharacterized protein n=1 Tax=Quillaja saponaria TaxID=32244 RepID=A0AAD7VN95_QUISA|nr:hypothetical protein O6P43_001121 [Quillaja saponaria]